jgi:hypothetical protein
MAVDQRKREPRHFDGPQRGPIYSPGSMSGRTDRNDDWHGVAAGWVIAGELLSALIVWGGIGYLADRLLWGEPRVFTPIGMLLGFGLGMYLLYLRYIRGHDDHER